MIILNCSNAGELGKLVAKHLNIKYYDNVVKRFPDNEVYIKLGADVKNKKIIIVQSLDSLPDEHLIELLFSVRSAKSLGAKRIIILIPYLAYMRQDHRFFDLECINCKEVAHFINHSGADELITVDPHLHRVESLNQIFKVKTRKVSAAKDIAEFVNKKLKLRNPCVIGPDMESEQWSKSVAEELKCESRVFRKQRLSSTKVNVKVIKESFRNKDAVIIDDIASTCKTLINTAKKIRGLGARSIHCIVTHGLFVQNLDELEHVADSVTSTNTVTSEHSRIDLSKTIAGIIE